MRNVLCPHHNMDGDLRGWKLMFPLVDCPACRSTGRISQEAIDLWFAAERTNEQEGGRVVATATGKVRIVEAGDVFSNVSRDYLVYLLEGEMPGHDEMLRLCGEHPFGGRVDYGDPKMALATCYLD